VRGAWRVARWIGLCLAAVPSLAAAAPLSLGAAQLGMTLAAWRALPAPDGAGAGAKAVCSNDAAVRGLAHDLLAQAASSSAASAAQAGAGADVCGYASVAGDYVLPRQVVVDPPWRGDVRHLFQDGRLAAIRYQTSINAYDALMAKLAPLYGAPTRTRRDRISTSLGRAPRVSQTWVTSDGRVELIDPGPDPARLLVTLSEPPSSSRIAAGAPAPTG
jgi:hypothetical protein